MTTEIYSCKDGQALKEGKLDIVQDINSKDEAASDALRRCQRDPSLKKVAYYKISEDGGFRVFYSYTNPNCKPAARSAAPAKPKAAVKQQPPAKAGLFAKIRQSLGL